MEKTISQEKGDVFQCWGSGFPRKRKRLFPVWKGESATKESIPPEKVNFLEDQKKWIFPEKVHFAQEKGEGEFLKRK
ncbi:unnamed protein product [Allacma fusca]|uniref:Uncharacterized protein n=1 Tax=Allacma fusca TaxID=39272 RepID=A0A8J2K1C5_9HEXA|nr:unnamed protein product [Allacma fusca]